MPLLLNSVSVAEKLKEETRLVHEETEKLLMPRLQGIRSKEDYAAILRMFYGIYCPLEGTIARFITPSILEDIATRRNASLALADVKALGLPTAPVSLAKSLPSINSAPAALGALYVLEGSTLGGRMIMKMLQRLPGLSLGPEQLNFFAGYKEETGPRWTLFLQVLNQWEHEAEAIVAAAADTFNCLSQWIVQTLDNGAEN